MSQPPMEQLDHDSVELLARALARMEQGFTRLPLHSSITHESAELEQVLIDVADRLKDNYPYFHPQYAGQMLKPPHRVARIAYALAMWINPNNHALDGGRASSAMEKEAVGQIAQMFGWTECLGHLCGGGTMANLEALWVAGQLKPGQTILASTQAHYTHRRISNVLGLNFEELPIDQAGRIDVRALEKRLATGDVGSVIATIGTTALGSVDPLPRILEMRNSYDFRIHADAAYGGYFGLTDNLRADTREAYERLNEVDSLVIDPHKHGLQPYGCGCILFRDPSVGRFYKHDSPYTYFSSTELHLGEISLECSRPGAAAVALWATQRLLPLVSGGEFSRMLAAGRSAALALYSRLIIDPRFLTLAPPELDIVVWALSAASVSEASHLARQVFTDCGRRDLHLALAEIPVDPLLNIPAGMERDRDSITCLRSTLMKPEHLPWLDRIWSILDSAVTDTVGAA